MSEDNEESSGIKVVDKRRFNPDGTEKEETAEASFSSETKVQHEERISPEINESALHEVSFANLILSLAGSAQMSLGIAPNPFTQKVEKDLAQAQQTIDLLAMLEAKTKGNLSPEEDSLLKVVLSDLRMRYVEEKNKA